MKKDLRRIDNSGVNEDLLDDRELFADIFRENNVTIKLVFKTLKNEKKTCFTCC